MWRVSVYHTAVSPLWKCLCSPYLANYCTSIVFRAFQGIGGSGIYSMVLAIVPNLVPPKKYPTYLAIVSSVFAFASFLGPTFGGLINDYTTWRWIFLIKCVTLHADSDLIKIAFSVYL